MPLPDVDALSRETGRSEDDLVREVLQGRILAEIFARRVRDEVILKGGLGMRAGFRSRRQTKDIDLHSGPEVPPARSQSLVRQAIRSALADGLLDRSEWSEPKMTGTVQRWKVRGFRGETEVHLTVELSRRATVSAAERRLVPYEGLGAGGVLVETLTDGAMAAAKVLAMTDLRREAPRDLYDLDLMIRAEVRPSPELLARAGLERLVQAREILSDRIEKLDFRAARDELLDYLPRDEAERFDAETWAAMQARTYLAVNEWLEEAIALRMSQERGTGMRA